MTVCIASIYNNSSILAASDRMVTGGYGDITFEPSTPKIIPFTTSIAVMTAGDQSIQTQVLQEARKIVEDKITTNPEKWLYVSEVAEIYSKCYYDLKSKLIEDIILSPFKLDLTSYISRQKEMDSDFVDKIAIKIARFDVEYLRDKAIETIVMGVDDSGPHIYVVTNGEISCNDKLGFASIGIGSSHAISHFMLSSYSKNDSEAKALLTIHQAKKKSEVSPGVGKETDMCIIWQKGSFAMIEQPTFKKPIVKDLDRIYEKYKQATTKLDKKTEKQIETYLDELASGVTPTQEIGADPSASASVSPSSAPSPKPTEKEKAKK